MFESCLEIRRQFSEYVDDVCSDETRHSIRYHLRTCGGCERELERYQLLCSDLRALPVPRLPASAELRLNVTLSRARHSNVLSSLGVRFENALRPLLLPASGAVLAGVFCLALTLSCLIVPPAAPPDNPLATGAAVEALEPVDFDTGADGLCLVTHVNADGRVVDYSVVGGQRSPRLKSELDRVMYFSVFRPATRLGKPTDGELVLSLRRITVRGLEPPSREESNKPTAPPSESQERSRV
jgi:anti-sigma factor RsiW